MRMLESSECQHNMSLWSVKGLDLSLIEKFWSVLGMQLNAKKSPPTSLPVLEKNVTKTWNKITQMTLKNLKHSIPVKVQAVILVNCNLSAV